MADHQHEPLVDEGTTRDFGELIFGEYGDDVDAFLARVEASLQEPSSRAAKYMASVRHKLHDDKDLARTCILTQARVAFRFVRSCRFADVQQSTEKRNRPTNAMFQPAAWLCSFRGC